MNFNSSLPRVSCSCDGRQDPEFDVSESKQWRSEVITGTDLMSFAKDAEGSAPHPMLKGFTRRMSKDGAILVLVGQPGTGKKTLIKQAILGMNGDELENSALLFCGFSGSCKTLRVDIDSL